MAGGDFHPGQVCFVREDIVFNDQIAFHKGDRVRVEKIDPNPQNPVYKYVVFSNDMQRSFELRDKDLESEEASGREDAGRPAHWFKRR